MHRFCGGDLTATLCKFRRARPSPWIGGVARRTRLSSADLRTISRSRVGWATHNLNVRRRTFLSASAGCFQDYEKIRLAVAVFRRPKKSRRARRFKEVGKNRSRAHEGREHLRGQEKNDDKHKDWKACISLLLRLALSVPTKGVTFTRRNVLCEVLSWHSWRQRRLPQR